MYNSLFIYGFKDKEFLQELYNNFNISYSIHTLDDVKKDWSFTTDYILEKKVNLKQEISVVITRFVNGETYIYEPIENVHKDQILKHSKIPADINEGIFNKAQKMPESESFFGLFPFFTSMFNFIKSLALNFFKFWTFLKNFLDSLIVITPSVKDLNFSI